MMVKIVVDDVRKEWRQWTSLLLILIVLGKKREDRTTDRDSQIIRSHHSEGERRQTSSFFSLSDDRTANSKRFPCKIFIRYSSLPHYETIFASPVSSFVRSNRMTERERERTRWANLALTNVSSNTKVKRRGYFSSLPMKQETQMLVFLLRPDKWAELSHRLWACLLVFQWRQGSRHVLIVEKRLSSLFNSSSIEPNQVQWGSMSFFLPFVVR